MMRMVIFGTALFWLSANIAAATPEDIERLFRQASSGEIRFQKLVQPSKDSLAALGDSAAKYLVAKLATTDARTKHTLVDIYRGIGKVATPYLLGALATENKDQLKTTARCLADIKDTLALDGLLGVAGHVDFTVRVEAVTAIAKTGGVRAGRILEPFALDSVELVRKSAVAGWGMERSPRFVPNLINALSDPYYGVRLVAYDALVAIDTAAHSAILPALRVASSTARPLLIRLAGNFKLKSARDDLEKWIDDPDPAVRGWTVWALAQIIGKKSRALFSVLAATDRDPFVRWQAETALSVQR